MTDTPAKDHVEVTIDGTVLKIRTPVKFKALKKCWPALQRQFETNEKAQAAAKLMLEGKPFEMPDIDPIESMSAAIEIVSAGLMQTDKAHTVDWVEENIDALECMQLGNVITEIMQKSGLIAKAPEGGAATQGEPEAAAPEVLEA